MSFMHVTCLWCHAEYTFGMVGSTIIGSGHSCETVIPCEEEGCSRVGNFAVMHPAAFVCDDHIGDRRIVMCQPGGA